MDGIQENCKSIKLRMEAPVLREILPKTGIISTIKVTLM